MTIYFLIGFTLGVFMVCIGLWNRWKEMSSFGDQLRTVVVLTIAYPIVFSVVMFKVFKKT